MSAEPDRLRVAALVGGVGGSKLALGLANALPPDALTLVVNTGDDFEYFGLHISPDLDTVTYTLAGLANPEMGWGLKDETWRTAESLAELGEPIWFRLGDRDLGTHLVRTEWLRRGLTLTEVTRRLCAALSDGALPSILPMSDDAVRTVLDTDAGTLDFQEYFVRRHYEPAVYGIRYVGAARARLPEGVAKALNGADLIVIAPSNPMLSIAPILAVPGVRALLARKPVIAVSPIVGGAALKGPAAKLMSELGMDVSPLGVAAYYGDLLDMMIIDRVDADLTGSMPDFICTHTAQTIMRTAQDKIDLAHDVIRLGRTLL